MHQYIDLGFDPGDHNFYQQKSGFRKLPSKYSWPRFRGGKYSTFQDDIAQKRLSRLCGITQSVPLKQIVLAQSLTKRLHQINRADGIERVGEWSKHQSVKNPFSEIFAIRFCGA